MSWDRVVKEHREAAQYDDEQKVMVRQSSPLRHLKEATQ